MGRLAAAIEGKRQQSRQPHGGMVGDETGECEVLVGTIGFVAGTDHCIALNETDVREIEQGEAPILGVRFTVLIADRVQMAKARGASYASCTLDEVRAEVVLNSEFDVVLRLLDADTGETTVRALARLRPAAISPALQFPLSLRDAVNLLRLGMLTGTPPAILCPIDVSASDLEILRDAGLGCMPLQRGATSDDVAAIKQRIAGLQSRAPGEH